MKTPEIPPDPELEGLLRRLHSLQPGTLPAELEKSLKHPGLCPPAPPPGPLLRLPRWWWGPVPVAAALTLGALLSLERFTSLWMLKRPAGDPRTPNEETLWEEADPLPGKGFRLERERIRTETLGTASAGEGTYQIVKITLLNRMWDTSESGPPRLLNESTAEQFVALPLEVF